MAWAISTHPKMNAALLGQESPPSPAVKRSGMEGARAFVVARLSRVLGLVNDRERMAAKDCRLTPCLKADGRDVAWSELRLFWW